MERKKSVNRSPSHPRWKKKCEQIFHIHVEKSVNRSLSRPRGKKVWTVLFHTRAEKKKHMSTVLFHTHLEGKKHIEVNWELCQHCVEKCVNSALSHPCRKNVQTVLFHTHVAKQNKNEQFPSYLAGGKCERFSLTPTWGGKKRRTSLSHPCGICLFF